MDIITGETERLKTSTATLSTCRSILDNFTANGDDQVKPRIRWAKKVLETIEEYTQKPEEQLRRDYTSPAKLYLAVLVEEWEDTLPRQKDECKYEVVEWIRSIEVGVLGLPLELKCMIHTATKMDPSLVVESNYRLQEFLALPSSDKLKQAEVLLKNSELASNITQGGDVSGNVKNLILASRTVPPSMTPGTAAFKDLVSDMSTLATAFNYLDPAADIKLLKVQFGFHYEHGNKFVFAQQPPYLIASMTSLKDTIRGDSFPHSTSSLTARLRLASQLAEAVFFLHTAGLLHQNITSSSIVVLRPSTSIPDSNIPDIRNSYLMVSSLQYEALAGTFDTAPDRKGDCEDFRHPDLLEGHRGASYCRSYDIYSLGIVLLEVGLWQPLEKAITIDTTISDLSNYAKALPKLLGQVGTRLGSGYETLVEWCLGLKGDDIVRNDEFLRKVLIPLGDMAKLT